MLADGLRCDLDPETLLDHFDELSSVPCALLREFLLEQDSRLLGDTRRVAGCAAIGDALKATLLPAVEVPADTRPASPSVSGDPLDALSSTRKAQHLGT